MVKGRMLQHSGRWWQIVTVFYSQVDGSRFSDGRKSLEQTGEILKDDGGYQVECSIIQCCESY